MQRFVADPVYLSVLRGIYPLQPFPMSEDCLSLNVWSSELGMTVRAPVMVWLHPGGFAIGAGNSPWSDGLRLAKHRGVIVVSVTHRLNLFGHLHFGEIGGPEYADSGNAGVLDLIAALTWVHENIAQFGGDPGNVTIFGESGGGCKVSTLLAMPAARGLFHKAIIQSTTLLRGASPEGATAVARRVLDRLGIAMNDLEALRSVPAGRLQAAATQEIWWPVVTGKSLPAQPFDSAPSITADIPLMIGTTHDEETYGLLSSDAPNPTTEAQAIQALINALWWEGLTESNLVGEILSRFNNLHPNLPALAMFIQCGTAVSRDDATAVAERKAALNKASVFMYRFDWASVALAGRYRAGHAIDIPFVFDNLAAAPQLYDGDITARLAELASRMAKAWCAFARHGNPNHSALPDWKPYTAVERATMLFDDDCRLVIDPDSTERELLARFRDRRIEAITLVPPTSVAP